MGGFTVGPTAPQIVGGKADLRRYVTDNPGAWMLHCHLQWHVVVSVDPYHHLAIALTDLEYTIQSGMAVVLIEGEDQLPGLVGNSSTTNESTAYRIQGGKSPTILLVIAAVLAALWL